MLGDPVSRKHIKTVYLPWKHCNLKLRFKVHGCLACQRLAIFIRTSYAATLQVFFLIIGAPPPPRTWRPQDNKTQTVNSIFRQYSTADYKAR